MKNLDRAPEGRNFRDEMKEILADLEIHPEIKLTPEAQELMETLKTEVFSEYLTISCLCYSNQWTESSSLADKRNLRDLFTDKYLRRDSAGDFSGHSDGNEYYSYFSGVLIQNAGEMYAPRYCLREANPNGIKNKSNENNELIFAVYPAKQDKSGVFMGPRDDYDMSDKTNMIGYLRKNDKNQIVFSNAEMIPLNEDGSLVQMHEGDLSIVIKG